MAVVVLVAPNNRVETALRFIPKLLNALQSLETGQLVKLTLNPESEDTAPVNQKRFCFYSELLIFDRDLWPFLL